MILTRKWSVGSAETDVVKPSHDDKSPACRRVLRGARREESQHDRRDGEEQTVSQVAANHRPPASDFVDARNAHHLRDQRQDRRYALIFERIVGSYTHILEYYRAVILNRTNTSHLYTCLYSADQE